MKGGQVLPKKTTYAVRKNAEAPKGRRDGMSMACAAALIEKAKNAGPAVADPSVAATNELRLLIEHNDTTSSQREKVRAEDAVVMLNGMGWQGKSRTALDSLCKRLFGRRSYGTP